MCSVLIHHHLFNSITCHFFFPLLGASMNAVAVSLQMSLVCARLTTPCPGCKCFATTSFACSFRGGFPPPPPPFGFFGASFGGIALCAAVMRGGAIKLDD